MIERVSDGNRLDHFELPIVDNANGSSESLRSQPVTVCVRRRYVQVVTGVEEEKALVAWSSHLLFNFHLS